LIHGLYFSVESHGIPEGGIFVISIIITALATIVFVLIPAEMEARRDPIPKEEVIKRVLAEHSKQHDD